MKTILYVFAILFISAGFTSCTPTSIVDDVVQTPQACCDGEGTIPPPPPPPPPGGGVTGG